MVEGSAELTRQRISEALFLIGFGVFWAIDWLWPGLVVAFGVAWTTSLAIRRNYWAATVIAVILCVVPIVCSAIEGWEVVAPFLIVGVGTTGLIRAFHLRK